MTCHAIRKQIGRYLDADLGFLSCWLLRRHLLACPACFDDYEERGGLGDLRNDLPAVPFPLSVRASVLVAVSHRLNAQPWERLRNQVENFLRPRAVSATGGVLAAVILFLGLCSDIVFIRNPFTEDVPLTYMTKAWISEPSLAEIPGPVLEEDVTVEAFIDREGRVYHVRMLEMPQNTPDVEMKIKSQVRNILLTTKFDPATRFGKPVFGRVLVAFRSVIRETVYG